MSPYESGWCRKSLTTKCLITDINVYLGMFKPYTDKIKTENLMTVFLIPLDWIHPDLNSCRRKYLQSHTRDILCATTLTYYDVFIHAFKKSFNGSQI